MNSPYGWLQDFIGQVPEILQPFIVALVAAVPYIEGEGAAAFGVIAGINPVIAAIAAAAGNILCVVGVVLLGSRVRERVVVRREAKLASPHAASSRSTALITATDETSAITVQAPPENETTGLRAKQTGREKGRSKIQRWLVRFGVPGASIIAPLALPTMLTAAFFVGSGIPKQWVILWQVIAIVLWTTAITLAATGVIAVLGW